MVDLVVTQKAAVQVQHRLGRLLRDFFFFFFPDTILINVRLSSSSKQMMMMMNSSLISMCMIRG